MMFLLSNNVSILTKDITSLWNSGTHSEEVNRLLQFYITVEYISWLQSRVLLILMLLFDLT